MRELLYCYIVKFLAMKKYIYFQFKINVLLFLLLITITQNTLQAQVDYEFEQDCSIQVQKNDGSVFQTPWAGGMNSMQFCQLDLNRDGLKDLVAFDKHGNRILCYINNGTSDSIDYAFSPEYQFLMPNIQSWLIMLDYNCDGKNDVFTYSNGGIAVYKNISDNLIGFKFQFITSALSSQQGLILSSISLSNNDYPAIADIDNDGDIDILVSQHHGDSICYHKNYSMDSLGVCGLKFRLETKHWGLSSKSKNSGNNLFQELSVENTSLVNSAAKLSGSKASGSTMLLIDIDRDADKDLILGNNNETNLNLFKNVGNPDTAQIILQDTAFPSNSVPVNLISFPVASCLDINNDSLKDILVSSFESDYYGKADNINNVQYYKNVGDSLGEDFSYQTNDFFQSEMLDVGSAAMPVFCDYNNDGLKDLFIGNYGYIDTSYIIYGDIISEFTSAIALFENIGTLTQPKFKLISTDFANVSNLNLKDCKPTFGDIDGDGDIDMLIGNHDGTIHYFQNTAGIGNAWNLVFSQSNYQGIDVGKYSTPELVDLNQDSLLDLVVGEQYNMWSGTIQQIKKGNLNYYKNTGTATNPVFTFVTDSLGRVDVTDNYLNYSNGYSYSCFFKDSIGNFRLAVGSGSGKIYYYKDIENKLTGRFTVDSSLTSYNQYDATVYYSNFYQIVGQKRYCIKDGQRAAPAIADINNDGYQDMIVGNLSGGLSFYKGIKPTSNPGICENIKIPQLSFNLFPNPTDNMITISLSEFNQKNNVVLQIFDNIGNLVLTKKFNNSNQTSIKTDKLSNGIYICRLYDFSNNKSTFDSACKKFVVNH